MAAEFGHLNVVETLVAFGGDVDTRCNRGRTTLLRAALKSRVDVVRVLLKLDANAKLLDNCGFGSMHTLSGDIKTMLREHELKSVNRF